MERMTNRKLFCVRGLENPQLVTLVVLGLVIGLVSAAPAQFDGGDPRTTLTCTETGRLQLPSVGKVVGLTWMGSDTLAVLMDLTDKRSATGERQVSLVFQNAGGSIIGREDFSGVLDRGLAWNGEFLWSSGDADDGSSIIYKIGIGPENVWQVLDTFDAPGHRPSDMCYDGRFIWITDKDSGRVDRFDPEVEEITRSAVTPGFSPHGVGWDGQNMWLTDSGTGLMYRLSGSRRTWSATIDADSFLHRGQDVLLLAKGGEFWYVPAGRNVAVRIRFQ